MGTAIVPPENAACGSLAVHGECAGSHGDSGAREGFSFPPCFPPRSLGKSPCKQFPIHTWKSGPQRGHMAPRLDNGTEDLASSGSRGPASESPRGEEAAVPPSASAKWPRNSPAQESLQVHGPSCVCHIKKTQHLMASKGRDRILKLSS